MIGIFTKIKSGFKRIIEGSKILSPRGFDGFSVHDVVQYTSGHYNFQGLTEKAAAISYNFMMSIPPICLFIFTLIPNLPFISKSGIKVQLHRLIQDIIPSSTYNQGLMEFVDSFIDGSKIGVISFTFIITLFFASNAVMGLIRAFSQTEISMGLRPKRGLRQRWEAIKLTLMLLGLLFLTMILLFLQSNILEWLGIHNVVVKNFILIAKWILIGALIFFSYAFIYRYASSTAERWQLISPGAVIATTLSILVSIGFVIFVENFARYNFLYGSIGTAMVVMVMVFLNSMVIFFGFTLNLTIHLLGEEQEVRE